MHQGGTLNDFIYAIGIMGGGKDAEDIILYLRQDWQKFLKLVSKLGKTVAVHMAEINSLLSQRSSSILPLKLCDKDCNCEEMASKTFSTFFSASWDSM